MLIMAAAPAAANFQPDLQLRLASEEDSAYLGGGVFEPIALFQSKTQAAFPGAPAAFRVLIRNAGDQPDTFVLLGTGSGTGFTVSVRDQSGVDRSADLAGAGYITPTMAPGQALSFLVQVAPAPEQLGASFRVVVQAVSLSELGRMDQVKLETVSCGTSAAVFLSAPSDGSGTPGSQVSYPYTLINVGSAPNSFSLSASIAPGWRVALHADDGAGGGIAGDGLRQPGENTPCASTGVLAPGQSFRFFLVVTIPAGAADRARADSTLTVTGEGASDSGRVVTSALAPIITLSENVRNLTQGGPFAASANAVPGDTLEYRMTVTNSGSVPAAPLTLASPLPEHSTCLDGSLMIATSAGAEGGACPASSCGWVAATAGTIVAHLGEGATSAAGGSLVPGRTLHVFFRVRVE